MAKHGTMLPIQKVKLTHYSVTQLRDSIKLDFLVGFFPAEMVFTERAIPVLVKQGIEWVMVANNHISRACKVRRQLKKITRSFSDSMNSTELPLLSPW